MKKLLIIITLFVSSFFFISLKEAKAYEYTTEVEFSHINDEFLLLKSSMEEFLRDNSSYTGNFFILFVNNLGYCAFTEKDKSTFELSFTSSTAKFKYTYWDRYQLDDSNLVKKTYTDMYSNRDFIKDSSYNPILYMNFNLISSNAFKINYIYEDFTYIDSSDTNNKISSLYDIYLKYQEHIGNKDLVHKEEIEKVESFYTTVIEKLSYLGEVIVSNYIYLSIIVIFILIFVFLLIFRRHL